MSALLAKATGLLFCRSAVPRPTCEALTCMVTVSEGGVADDGLLDSLKSSLIAGIPGEVGIFFEEFLQRSCQSGQVTDEGAEVCHHAEELLEFSDICGNWESMYSINLLWVWVDTIGIV